MTTVQSEIEQRLATEQPEVEVLLAEVLGGSTLRVYIDHPKGVSLALCEQVTVALADLRERYTLEGLLARHRTPADQARPLPSLRGQASTGAHTSSAGTGGT